MRIAKDLIDDLNKQLAAAVHEKGEAEYARDEAQRAKQEAEVARNEAKVAKETAEEDGYNAGVAKPRPPLRRRFLECSGFIAPKFGKKH